MTVRTRFAPSPTGVLHIGSVRTALFCWLWARHNGGKFVLRIEDTDRQRSTEENVTAILEGMTWLGLDADEGPHFQSERLERYREVSEQLLESGDAYQCYCTKDELAELREQQMAANVKTRYDGRCRSRSEPRDGVEPVIRFKNPLDGEVIVNDAVRGEVVFQNTELDDLIMVRSDGMPTYNFSVIVDDHDMNITHVVRGDDHLNNTPRQMNMLAALGVTPPAYAHLPMILGADGAKLSKRHGAVDVRDYREQGYLPEALINYLVRLGWSNGDQEIFSTDEMIQLFDIAAVNQSASAFNSEKLVWLNQQYILAMSPDELGERLLPYFWQSGIDPSTGPDPVAVAAGFHERAETLVQMAESCRYCYQDFDDIDAKAAKKNLRPVILEPMQDIRARFEALEDWTEASISDAIEASAAAHEINMGKLGQPIRVAVTGGSVSPPIDVTVKLVGRERTLDRLDRAIVLIQERAAASGN
jgi:glutamyl-tRNA synthetase